MDKKKLLFVINPISGGKSKDEIPGWIENNLNALRFSYEIYWWNEVDELTSAVRKFITDGGDVVAAVGGDGTVNLIAKELMESEVALAIIPMGSGNGLARELNIPLHPVKAIQKLNATQPIKLDVGFLNDAQFVNVGGWGFDAQVSVAFSNIKKRGFWSYVKAIMFEYKHAKNYRFEIKEGEQSTVKEAFMLTVANGTQWGNDFFVAPDASYSDGQLDLVFLKKPKLIQIPGLIISLYRKKENRLLSRMRIKGGEITCDKAIYTHLDGEPAEKCDKISLKVKKDALTVWV